jgi:probable F420-dependent oxidoreductase
MRFGVSMFVTDQSASPADVAREAEERAFDSFWVSEHSHIPVSTRFPLADTVPREYASMLDPFVALTSAAAATRAIRLGTAICILTQHDPINCAKAVASVDVVSGGRMLFGIGAGWNEPELRNHGTDPARRFKLMRERAEAMKVLWTREEAEYHGELVDFDPVWQWPKPVQKPHPPLLVAGAGPNVLKRAARYGDGWLPVVVPEATALSPGRMTPIAELMSSVPTLREMAARAGRGRPMIVASGAALDLSMMERLIELEVDSLLFRLASTDIDQVRKQLDVHADTVRQLVNT